MIPVLTAILSSLLISAGIAAILTYRSLFRFILGIFSASIGAVYLISSICPSSFAIVLIASISGISEAVLISFLISLSKSRKVEDFDELREHSG
ncbi:MAG: hypothetical protein QW039_05335 [Fervidicoccaceae archaeon]